jgi:hypothetical protein
VIYDLNGKRVSLTDATIDIAGYRMLGAAGLKLKETLEPGEVEGASSIPVGYTDGPWSGSGGFEAPLSEALDMLSFLGNRFGKRIASASFTFTSLESSDGVKTIEIPAMRITSPDLDGGDRSKHAKIAFEVKLLEPALWNGVRITDDGGDAIDGAVSFVLSAFGG